MKPESKISFLILSVVLISILIGQVSLIPLSVVNPVSDQTDKREKPNVDYLPETSNLGSGYSNLTLSIVFDDTTSSVEGNLTVDFYNNDPHNFTRIPFHLYLSGMVYESRSGSITILNVTDFANPNIALPFEVIDNEVLWVNLSETLEPMMRVQFIISFTAIIPDGGMDRANSHGADFDQSRIYKFAHFYPIPCVHDRFDGWNTDPYLSTGDPFYFDMAYYQFYIETPSSMVIAATGKLTSKTNKGATVLYHYDPLYPVREVTFSASEYFLIDSTIYKGVNVSTYYLPSSETFWSPDALNSAKHSLNFFNQTFGTYPYPTLNIVEEYTLHGGMEYPCQVYITGAIPTWGYPISVQERLLDKFIVHEVCHQWWYNLVGFDEIDWGFLDEGLTCWSTDYYALHMYGDWLYYQYTEYFDRVRSYYVDTGGLPSKVNQSVYESWDSGSDYIYISYYKSPLMLELISRAIEIGNFIEGLKHFFEQYKYDIAYLPDLHEALEDITGYSLDWLFFPLFDNSYIPKYAFSQAIYDGGTSILELVIVDTNEARNLYPYSQQVPLYIYDENNILLHQEDIWINGTTTITLSMSETPKKARLTYNEDILVQLPDPPIYYIEITVGTPIISGYNIFFVLMMVLSLIGLSILSLYKKISRNNYNY